MAALPHRQFQTLDVFCDHPLGWMDRELGIFLLLALLGPLLLDLAVY